MPSLQPAAAPAVFATFTSSPRKRALGGGGVCVRVVAQLLHASRALGGQPAPENRERERERERAPAENQ